MTRSLIENIKKNDVSEGVAVDIHGNYITPSGETFSLNDLSTTNRSRLSKFRKKTINSFDPNTVFGPSYVKPPKKKVKKNTTAKLKKKIVKKVKKKKVKKKSH